LQSNAMYQFKDGSGFFSFIPYFDLSLKGIRMCRRQSYEPVNLILFYTTYSASL
jgi:hypothetical protein